MIQVSIIIPIYNVEPYIEKCLQSVADQTYQGSMECLLIDDCGQDQSMVITEQFVSEYNKKTSCNNLIFRILHHDKNRGLSAARNTGIKYAQGEWLYFLDSDDCIIPECIELMMECVTQHPDVELIHAGAKCSYQHEYMSLENRTLPIYANNPKWISPMIIRLWVTAWNNLIKKEYIVNNQLCFEDGILSEDEVWTFDLSLHPPRLAFVLKDTYNYLWRENSIMTKINNKHRGILLIVWHKEIDRLNSKNNYQIWHIQKIWNQIFRYYDTKFNFKNKWRIRFLLLRLATKARPRLALAIILSSILTSSRLDNYLHTKIINKYMWEGEVTCNPVI